MGCSSARTRSTCATRSQTERLARAGFGCRHIGDGTMHRMASPSRSGQTARPRERRRRRARRGPRADAGAGRLRLRRGPRARPLHADEPAGLGPRAHRRVRGPVARPPLRRAAAAARRAGRRLRRVRDPARRPRRRCRSCARRRRASTWPRSARARSRSIAQRGSATAILHELVAPPRAAAQRDDAADAPARPAATATSCPAGVPPPPAAGAARHTGLELVEIPAGECTIGAPADRLRLRQRAPAPPHRRARLPDRPHADHQRDLPDLRRGRRLRAARVVVRRGLGVEGGVRHHHDLQAGRRTSAPSGAWAGSSHSTRIGPSSTSPGSRPTPSPARTTPASRPRSSGRRRRPGTRSWSRARRIRGATSRRSPASTPTSTSSAGGPAPAGAYPAGASPVRVPGDDRRRLGVDRKPTSTATRASRRIPTASTPRSFFGSGYSVLRGGLVGDARARVATATFRNWDYPQRRQIFAGLADREGPDEDRCSTAPTSSIDSCVSRPSERCARRRRARRAHAAVQGAAAQALLRRPRLGAVRADLRAARVLPDPHRARDPRASRAPRSSRSHRRRRARRARLGRRGQGADPARRDGARPGRCAATSRSTCPSTRSSEAAEQLVDEYDGLQVHGVIGDFERHLDERPRAGRRPADRRAARRHDRQLPARAAAGAAAARDRRAARSRGPAAARHRPRQGPRA